MTKSSLPVDFTPTPNEPGAELEADADAIRRRSEIEQGRMERDAAMWRLSNGNGSGFFADGQAAFLKLLLRRDAASINDLREVLPPRDGVSPNAYGPILMSLSRRGLIHEVGREPITHRAAHARKVPRWQLTDRDRATAFLLACGHNVTDPQPARQQTLFDRGEG
jgi:hypothetical protein